MKERIISILRSQGFELIGFLDRSDAQFSGWIDSWLDRGYAASMSWMNKHKAIREDPCSIVEDGQSIMSLGFPYYTQPPDGWVSKNPISNYAWGEDYHVVLRKKLRTIMASLLKVVPGFQGRFFVDTAPLPEKLIAASAGLGWIGRNSMLIHPKHGSYFFLAEIVSNLNLPTTSEKQIDRCGDCRLCIENCPTESIKPDRQIDARTCISYLTIEKRGPFTSQEAESIEYQLFGCDICQQICPWNKDIAIKADSPFSCFNRWRELNMENLIDLTETSFEQMKRKSGIKRARLEGIKRNAGAVLNR